MTNSEGIEEQGIGEEQVTASPSGIPDESAGAFDTTGVTISTPTGTPLEEIEGVDVTENPVAEADRSVEDIRLDDEPLFDPDDVDNSGTGSSGSGLSS